MRGEVARCGMGMIYKVWDENLRRTLAMKVVLGADAAPGSAGTSQPDKNRLNRFLEEAQITGQLDHPGIVPVHELGLDDEGRVYFTMRLVKGRDLKQVFELVRRGEEGWTLTRALHVMLKVCEAMAFAHEKGVVHRDLKPANVMVGRFGEVYVMDWGLAKVVGREDHRDLRPRADPQASLSEVRTDRRDQAGSEPDAQLYTMDGDIVGTPCYMSPEQARGEMDRFGPRADVYSAGAMLYHLLAARMPYVPPEGVIPPQAVLALLIHGPPQALAEAGPDLPPELVAICEKAMAREPEGRYETMLAMAEDLRAFLEGRVVRAYETGAAAEFKKWVRRNRAVAASLAALLAVVVGGSIGFAWQQGRLARRIAAQRLDAALARDEALASEREAVRKSYLANLVAADVYLKANEVPEAVRLLEACDEGLRGWEWRHLALKADGSLAALPHPGEVGCVAFAPDGELLATGCADGVVRLWRAPQGEAVAALAGHGEAVLALAFAPGGARLASASRDGSLRVWDLASERARLVLSDHEAPVTAVAFSATGERLASGAADGGVRLWDPVTGHPLASFDTGGRSVAALALSADGGRLSAACADGGMAAWDTASGEPVPELAGGEGAVECAAFDRGAERLATGSIDGSVRVRELRTGGELARLRAHADPVF
ncbi:MAG TPA: serine/threonine-protein kinase, partial [Planctomycetota bacterium]|nr:serine/threonine-protein kinase [Planctomycetota bacterium]